LQDRRVVVTRPKEKATHLMDLLRSEGAHTIHFPTIQIADPGSWAEVDAAVSRLESGDYDWVVFTSVNAVERFTSRMSSTRLTARVAAVGAVTERALRNLGIDVAIVPDEFTGAAMATALGAGSGKILLPRVQDAPRATTDALRAQGWTVDEVVSYRNVMPQGAELGEDFDAITFASGSAARNFAAMTDPDRWRLRDEGGSRVVACIGPHTASAAREAGLRVDVVAAEHTDEGLVVALREHMSQA
jgi:uroporphyrinogen-III synthase